MGVVLLTSPFMDFEGTHKGFDDLPADTHIYQEKEEERVPTSEARTETDLEYAERISAWNMRGMESE